MLNPTLRISATYEVVQRGRGRVKGELEDKEVVAGLWEQVLADLPPPRLAKLARLGIFVDERRAPRPVRLDARLDDRLVPRAARVDASLAVNRRALLDAAPAGDLSFLEGDDVRWVETPNGFRSPLRLPRALAGPARAVVDGRLRPEDLAPRTRRLLALAGVLVPAGARRAWQDQRERLRLGLATEGHAVLRGLLTPALLAAFRDYYRRLEREGYLALGDVQAPDRKVAHNDAASRFLHGQLVPIVNQIVPEKVKGSYCYLARYLPGSRLPRHRDREQCAWNLSLLLDQQPEVERRRAWPIYLEVGGRPRAVRLEMGDGVLYRGTDVDHWRPPLAAGHTATLCFFHFVRRGFRGRLD